MQYRIDYMKELELNATLNLVKDVFDEFDGVDYEEEGIKNFYKFIDEKSIREKIDSGEMVILVARTTYNQIIGTIAVTADNHISLLFINKDFQRKGIGTNLLKFAINVCKYNDESIKAITVNSSPFAIDFYHKYGFEDIDELKVKDGIIYLPMTLNVADEDSTEEIIEEVEEDDNFEEEKIDTDKVYDILSDYYSESDEDNRLKKSKRGNLEFITTTTYIDKYLCRGDKILEIGAGTGVYSNYYANQGYKVDALELLDVNLEKLNELKGKNLKVHKGNAIDLSKFADNTFDITLCLGPLYHLFSEEEQNKAIKEAIRVTKPCGKIFFAYLTNESVIINHFLRERHLLDQKHLHDEDYIIKNDPNAVFYVSTVQEFKNKMRNYNVKFLNNVATDGISSIINNDLEYLDDEEFEEWINYHLATCERKDLIGYSSHVLFICEKE